MGIKMKSYLIIFLCLLVLMLNISSTSEKKSVKKSNDQIRKISNDKRPDPSGEPLPPQWTTGSRPKFPIQSNKNYQKYHKRLASMYKYKDHTKDLLNLKPKNA